MTICSCSGCDRSISVSEIPGGNWFALGSSNKYSVSWYTCDKCNRLFCDRCTKKRGGIFGKARCDCGGIISAKNNRDLQAETERLAGIFKQFE
jgi:hypothetical protein